MHTPEAFDSAFEIRVRSSFAKQGLMSTIGARVTHVAPGEVDVELPFRDDLSQQHGFLHAGVVAAIVDSACGYAALTLMPPDTAVLTSEYKINLLSPAAGDAIIARGRVLKAGRTLVVTRGDAFALKEGEEKLVATMLATMMTVRKRGLRD
jgi:uncharacterized protein (TIGR00369 family)